MKKNFPFLVLLGFLAVASFASVAVPGLADLGQGLSYQRVSTLTGPEATSAPVVADTPSLVLDLRGTTADEPSATALMAALHRRPDRLGVCLILISPDTSPALLVALGATPAGCLTVGRADGACHPDIAVATTAEADQRARTALAAGTAPIALLAAPADKARHDEAELARDHAAGKNPADEDDSSAVAAPKPVAKETPPPQPGPPVDAVLQRALQVHRGLLALRKIPGP